MEEFCYGQQSVTSKSNHPISQVGTTNARLNGPNSARTKCSSPRHDSKFLWKNYVAMKKISVSLTIQTESFRIVRHWLFISESITYVTIMVNLKNQNQICEHLAVFVIE